MALSHRRRPQLACSLHVLRHAGYDRDRPSAHATAASAAFTKGVMTMGGGATYFLDGQ